MKLSRWDPFAEMDNLRRQVNRVFDESFGHSPEPERAAVAAWAPTIDVWESDTDVTVEADLPGVCKDDIEISLTDDVLSISGERKPSECDETAGVAQRRERSFGQFHRALSLATSINPDAVSATYREGVLRVVVPKAEEAKPKQIQISPT